MALAGVPEEVPEPVPEEDTGLAVFCAAGAPLLAEAAGGEFAGPPGVQTTAEEVLRAAPDVLVAAWCGAGDRVPLEKTIASAPPTTAVCALLRLTVPLEPPTQSNLPPVL